MATFIVENEVPVFDFEELSVDQISQALDTFGFFGISNINSPIKEADFVKMEMACRAFFSLPLDEKMKIKMPNFNV